MMCGMPTEPPGYICEVGVRMTVGDPGVVNVIVNFNGAMAGASAAWHVVQPAVMPTWFIVPGTKLAGLWQVLQVCEVGMWPTGNVANAPAKDTVAWH